MQCPSCKTDNPASATRCTNCNAYLGGDAAQATVADFGQATVTQLSLGATQVEGAAARSAVISVDSLVAGSVLGGRYEILKLLGEGGMGAVYKARDMEVDRVVALKVIRPEYANRPEILARFKQELVLARQITHRNVIRIFDLGQADGIRFITMEYVEGQELYSLLRSAEPPGLERKVRIAREICKALESAHEQGVVHRDLKPQNIMVENNGRVLVMDFGIARSVEDTGLTSTGALIGTPAFMSPEQAKGEKLDTRSDLFSFGVIFYEMLTGRAAYQAETAVGLLLKRIQERPAPPIELNQDIPQALSDIVLKCLVVDREQRYQTAAEIIRDLEGWLGDPAAFRTELSLRAPTVISSTGAMPTMVSPTMVAPTEHRAGLSQQDHPMVTPEIRMMAESHAKKYIGISVAAVALILAGVYGVDRYLNRPAAPVAPMTVMIADFNNHTGDPVFSGTLESTLKLAMEGASFINAYDRARVRDLGLQPISGTLDEAAALKIAVGEGLNVVVSGSLDKSGSGYQLSLRAIQAVTGKVINTAEESASGKDQVLFALSKAAAKVRRSLGDATSESEQRFSMETLSAGSLEAVHEYSVALDALSSGKDEEAQKHFSQAADLDMNFGLAYAGMASASHNLGRQQDAEKYIKEAISHIDHMTERERFRTRAFLYLLVGDDQKCVDEYATLLTRYPADTGAHNNEAFCLTRLRKMPEALEQMRRTVAILPNRATYHANLSLYSSYGGDFPTAATEAARVLQLNPSYFLGFEAQAFADLGQDQLTDAAAAYQKLDKLRPWDAVSGFADLAVYEGRFNNAVSLLEKGAAADRAAQRPDNAADKFALLAYTQLLRQQKGPALEAVKNALELSKAVKTRFVAGQVYAALGESAKAGELASGLASELQIEPQAYAKLIQGEVLLKSGNARDAVSVFTDANRLLDTWMGRFDLGRAYLDSGAFTEADSEFDRCIRREGEVLSLFLDEVPTYGYFPPVYYYQGRVREGMKTGFAESYRKYLSIRGKAGEDPLLPEVRRRIGQ